MKQLDAWLARAIFWPIIIKVCQTTGCSKWAFGRLCAFLWICGIILTTETWTWFWSLFVGLIAIGETLSLGLRKDSPYGESGLARVVFWLSFVLGCVSFASGTGHIGRTATTLFMLFNLYAATLPTVPPRRRREEDKTVASSHFSV